MIAAPLLLWLFAASAQTLAPGQTNPPSQTVQPAQSRVPSPTNAASPAARIYRISGVVVDSVTGAPVSRAQVSISLSPPPSSGDAEDNTITTDGAKFSFEGVQPGQKYRLTAAAPGYVSESYNEHHGFTSDIAVGEGLDSEHIVFRLHPQAVVYGVVTDERGDPVRQAAVTLLLVARDGRGMRMSDRQMTDDLGEYRFAHLMAGKYYVMVQAHPWYAQPAFRYAHDGDASVAKLKSGMDVIYPATFYPTATDEHDAGELDLSPGDKREADVQLTAVPSIHIRVTNVPTEPNSPIGFHIQQNAPRVPIDEYLSFAPISPGEYELAGLSPGNASLIISEFGSQRHTETVQANISDADTIDVAAAAMPVASVSGKLIFPSAPQPLPRTTIILANDDQNFSTRAHDDGTFSFTSQQMLPGTYTVHVAVAGGRGENYIQELSAVGAKVSEHRVTIDSSTDTQLTITVGHGVGQINGITRVDTKPLAGAMILLIRESDENPEDNYRMDQSDTDGTFTLRNIIPGKYLLMAFQDGWDLDWRDPQILAPFRQKAQRLEIAPNQTVKISLDAQPSAPASAAPASAVPSPQSPTQ